MRVLGPFCQYSTGREGRSQKVFDLREKFLALIGLLEVKSFGLKGHSRGQTVVEKVLV